MTNVRKIRGSPLRNRRKSVAQSVVENQIVLCPERQDSGGLTGSVAVGGEIPVRPRKCLSIGSSRVGVVGQTQCEVTSPIQNFHARGNNENIGQRAALGEQSGEHSGFARVHKGGVIGVDGVPQGNVHGAAAWFVDLERLYGNG